MIPSYTVEGTIFGQYISENMPGKTVAVLWENDTVGIDGFAGLKQGLDPSKNQIVADESYEFTAISVTSEIANLKKSNADILVLNAALGFASQAIKNADRLGWHPQIIMTYINSDDMMFSFAPPKLLEGAITFQANKLAAWRDDPAVAQHYELMQKYGGPSPSNFTIYAQVLGETAVEVLKRSCDNLTREGLMERGGVPQGLPQRPDAGRRQPVLLAHRPHRLPVRPDVEGRHRRERQGQVRVLRTAAATQAVSGGAANERGWSFGVGLFRISLVST